MNSTLYKSSLKQNYKVLVVFSIIMVFYFSMIIVMFNPLTTDSMAALIEMLPQELIKMLGFTLEVPTYTGFIASYFYGFLVILFPTILLIMVSYRVMGKLIDRGSMAYLLATPNSRLNIVMTQAFALVSLITILFVIVTGSGIILSEIFFSGKLEIMKFLMINVGAWCYFFAVSGISFLANVFFNDGKNALSYASSFPVAFFVIQMVAQLDEKFELAKYFTLLTLFKPNEIILSGYNAWPLFALFGVGIVFYGISFVVFKQRNLVI